MVPRVTAYHSAGDNAFIAVHPTVANLSSETERIEFGLSNLETSLHCSIDQCNPLKFANSVIMLVDVVRAWAPSRHVDRSPVNKDFCSVFIGDDGDDGNTSEPHVNKHEAACRI